jgi:hypothetical protein
MAYSGETGSSTPHVAEWINADYFKDWLPYNLQATLGVGGPNVDTAEVGGFVTAPDGTTDTACLLKEKAIDSLHGFVSHTSSLVATVTGTRVGKLRFSGVFKYAGRRIMMVIKAGNYSTDFGCKAIFDLQAGTVAVDSVLYGSNTLPWVAYPAQISPVGNGWYLCSVFAQANFSMLAQVNGIGCRLMLDNGTGSMSERITYVGDGISGVYAWRSSLLPSRAWDLNNVTFFDDFDDNTMSNIDLNNTRTEGFDWYMRNPWPGWDWGDVSSTDASQNPDPGQGHGILVDPDNFSCSDSVLRIEHSPHKILNSAASTWNRPFGNDATIDFEVGPTLPRNYTYGWVGNAWAPPYLLEWKFSWNRNAASELSQAFWAQPIEFQLVGRWEDHTQLVYGRELDYFEEIQNRRFNVHLWPPYHDADTYGSFSSQVGNFAYWSDIVSYSDLHFYSAGANVERLGLFYTCIAPHGGYGAYGGPQPPETSPAYWTTYVNPASGAQPPTVHYDEMNTYEAIVFPWTPEEPGQIFLFFNGGLCCVPLVYGPDIDLGGTSTLFHLTDSHHEPIFIGANPDYSIELDWIRVTQ